jgi:hypothetical protein
MSSLLPRKTAVTIAAAVAILLPTSLVAQSQPPKTDTTRGLSIQYADGQISTSPVRRSGGMWTATFPKIAGAATSRDGVPLTTLDVKHVVDGPDVVVTIWLYYGGPGQNGVKAATVRLPQAEPVRVNELRAYGVEPITLSLVAIEPSTAYAPAVVSVSPLLTARAEAVGANVAAYRVLVTNRSTQPLMWLQFKAYRANRLAILGRPRGKRNLPLVQPNSEYGFEVTTSTAGLDAADGSETWQPIDRIELTSMMWQDGTVEGDPADAADQHRLDLRRVDQLEALLAVLRGARGRPLSGVREQIAHSMTNDLETRRARDSILQDLDRLILARTSSDSAEFRTWVSSTIPAYAEWLSRIVKPDR